LVIACSDLSFICTIVQKSISEGWKDFQMSNRSALVSLYRQYDAVSKNVQYGEELGELGAEMSRLGIHVDLPLRISNLSPVPSSVCSLQTSLSDLDQTLSLRNTP
jgi:hypothetical protein